MRRSRHGFPTFEAAQPANRSARAHRWCVQRCLQYLCMTLTCSSLEKCHENDVDLLESASSDLVERVEAAGKCNDGGKGAAGDAEDGWETESDGETLDDDEDNSQDGSVPELASDRQLPIRLGTNRATSE